MEQDRTEPVKAMGLLPPEQEFEQLRQGFHERLRRELTQLMILSETLQSAHIDVALVVGDIGMFAHRLRGAALVFEFPEIGAAAKAVEAAADVAAMDRSETPDGRSIVSTIKVLAAKLVQETANSASAAPVPHDSGDE